MMTRGAMSLVITAVLLIAGCGGVGGQEDPTLSEGVKVTLVGVMLEIRPLVIPDGPVRPIEEGNDYVSFGEAMVAIDAGMNLSVSTTKEHSLESFVYYGTVAASDTVLVDGNSVSVNGQPRSPAN